MSTVDNESSGNPRIDFYFMIPGKEEEEEERKKKQARQEKIIKGE